MKPTRSESYYYELWGWILFIFSAVFFIASSINSGDILSLIGGMLFLIACFIFITPLLKQTRHHTDD
jgi:hypothetical protein